MKKRILITGSVVLAIAALIVFNRMTSKSKVFNVYTEVKKGTFEITVSNSGELMAEKSLDIKGPEIAQTNQGFGGGGHGGDFHAVDLKIQDIVPEGTVVSKGDYIA